MRDGALIDFVETGSLDKFYAYCKKYKVNIPEDEIVMKAGILKAVQYCTNISDKIKVKAGQMALEMGFNPFVDWSRL